MEGSRQKAELRHVASRCLLELGNNVSQLRAAKRETRERIKSWMRDVSPSYSAAGSCSESESLLDDSAIDAGTAGTGTGTRNGSGDAPVPTHKTSGGGRQSPSSRRMSGVAAAGPGPEKTKLTLGAAAAAPARPPSSAVASSHTAAAAPVSKGDHVMISYRCVHRNRNCNRNRAELVSSFFHIPSYVSQLPVPLARRCRASRILRFS